MGILLAMIFTTSSTATNRKEMHLDDLNGTKGVGGIGDGVVFSWRKFEEQNHFLYTSLGFDIIF